MSRADVAAGLNSYQAISFDFTFNTAARVKDQEVLMTVADRGPGVPSEESGRIFEKFVRCKQAGGGGGLGLAISQGIVAADRGRIGVDNFPQEKMCLPYQFFKNRHQSKRIRIKTCHNRIKATLGMP